MASHASLQIGIVGGSIGGLFAGALLARDGHRVSVLERSHEGLARRGAGLVAQQELFDLLHRVGRSDAARHGVVAHERITLDRQGQLRQRDPRAQTQLSWDYLYETFRQQLPAECYALGQAVQQVDADSERPRVQLADGQWRAFDLLIGADGLGSVTRAAVAPEDVSNRYAGYAAWRGLIAETAVPADAARVLLGRFAFFSAPDSHALGYLVPGPNGEIEPGQRRYNWVWYRTMPPPAMQALLEQSHAIGARRFTLARGELPEPQRQALRADALAELPPPFAQVVQAEPQPFLQGIFDYVAPRLVRNRVLLLGDAAAVVRPHTAMGAAKAAGDAMVLADRLREHPVAQALLAYQHERLPVARAIAAYGQRLGHSLALAPA